MYIYKESNFTYDPPHAADLCYRTSCYIRATHKAWTLPIKQSIFSLSGVSWSHLESNGLPQPPDSFPLCGPRPLCSHHWWKLDPWHGTSHEPGEQGTADDGPLVDGVHDGALHSHCWTFWRRAGGENLPTNDVRILWIDFLYPSTWIRWVCNKRTETELADGQTSKLFWPLFQFIQGANAGNLTIKMTTPVTTLVTEEGSGFTLEMCFFLGSTEGSWPNPTAPSVYLQQAAERQIITRWGKIFSLALLNVIIIYCGTFFGLQEIGWLHEHCTLERGGGSRQRNPNQALKDCWW